MELKSCLITGSTSGIGREAALWLAEMGAKIIVHGRNKKRGEEVVKEIRRRGGQASGPYLADFSQLDEVRRLAREVKRNHEDLNVLINNAGVYFPNRRLSANGIEMTFVINYLAPFLLTNLLLDVLKRNAPSRIVNVSSTLHHHVTLDFNKIKGSTAAKGFEAYGLSKLCLIMFTYELAERLKGTGITVNCLHPGGIRSRLMRESKIMDFFWRHSPLLDSPRKGAETLVYLVSSDEVEGVSGKYFVNKKEASSSLETYNSDLRKRLWQVSEELTQLR